MFGLDLGAEPELEAARGEAGQRPGRVRHLHRAAGEGQGQRRPHDQGRGVLQGEERRSGRRRWWSRPRGGRRSPRASTRRAWAPMSGQRRTRIHPRDRPHWPSLTSRPRTRDAGEPAIRASWPALSQGPDSGQHSRQASAPGSRPRAASRWRWRLMIRHSSAERRRWVKPGWCRPFWTVWQVGDVLVEDQAEADRRRARCP